MIEIEQRKESPNMKHVFSSPGAQMQGLLLRLPWKDLEPVRTILQDWPLIRWLLPQNEYAAKRKESQ